MSALVVGSRTRMSTAIVRGLGHKGIPVYTADSSPFTRSSLSRYVRKHFTYTSPRKSLERFFADILGIIRSTKAKVLFSGDLWNYYQLIRNRKILDEVISFPAPNTDQIERVVTKEHLLELSGRMGILVPRSRMIRTANELPQATSDMRYPILMKPNNGTAGNGVSVCATGADLRRAISKYDDARMRDGLVVQEFIDGETYGVGMIFDSGSPCLDICYRQVHQNPVAGGNPTLTVTCTMEEPMAVLSRILRSLVWHGVCQADFIREKMTGKFYLIDINPRPFGALHTSIAAGVNFPYRLYLLGLCQSGANDKATRDNVKTIWVEGEIRRFLTGLGRFNAYFRSTKAGDYTGIDFNEDCAFGDFKPMICYPVWCLWHHIVPP